MCEYKRELVTLLDSAHDIRNVNGLTIEIKPVPDGDGDQCLDPRAKRLLDNRLADHGGWEEASTEPEIRSRMGGFNYNLNRVEIYTGYWEVATTAGPVPVWGYWPRRMQGERPALLYIHGGAFKGGTPFQVENACRLVAERADCVVFNIDYALPPEHPFPIPSTQIYEVLSYLSNHARQFGVDAQKIMIGGDSAGGNLAAVCAQMDADRNTHYLRGTVLLYAKLLFDNYSAPGYTRDLSQICFSAKEREYLPLCTAIGSDEANAGDRTVYVQGRFDVTHPYISPVFAKKEGLPPALILLAEYDGLRLEGEYYARQLTAANVPCRVVRYCGVCHGFFDMLGILPQAESAVNEIAAQLKSL